MIRPTMKTIRPNQRQPARHVEDRGLRGQIGGGTGAIRISASTPAAPR